MPYTYESVDVVLAFLTDLDAIPFQSNHPFTDLLARVINRLDDHYVPSEVCEYTIIQKTNRKKIAVFIIKVDKFQNF